MHAYSRNYDPITTYHVNKLHEHKMPLFVMGKSQACKASHVNIRGNIDKPASGGFPIQPHPYSCNLSTNANFAIPNYKCTYQN